MPKKLFVQDWLLEEVPTKYYVVAEDVKQADGSFDAWEIQKALCDESIAHPQADPKSVIELTDEEAKLIEGIRRGRIYYSEREFKLWRDKLPKFASLRKKLEGVL